MEIPGKCTVDVCGGNREQAGALEERMEIYIVELPEKRKPVIEVNRDIRKLTLC